jgi:hypothetical protein
VNVEQAIIVKVKPPTKRLAHQDFTPPNMDPVPALNAHPERMPTCLAPQLAKIVTAMHTNPNPKLRNAFQYKKDTTNPVPQPKSNARRVKQALVEMPRATIVKLGRINIFRAKPRALYAPVDLATKPKVPRHAMVYPPDRTVGTVKCVNVQQVIIAPAKPPTKRLVILGRMQPVQNQSRVLNVHLERMRPLLALRLAKIVTTMHTNPNPMLRYAFQCKKGSTNRAQQPKSNARRVKLELVVTKVVMIVI